MESQLKQSLGVLQKLIADKEAKFEEKKSVIQREFDEIKIIIESESDGLATARLKFSEGDCEYSVYIRSNDDSPPMWDQCWNHGRTRVFREGSLAKAFDKNAANPKSFLVAAILGAAERCGKEGVKRAK